MRAAAQRELGKKVKEDEKDFIEAIRLGSELKLYVSS